MKRNKKILLHACCAICSGYPIQLLRELGFEPVVYFFNPNIFPEAEYEKRLLAQKTLCENFDCELIIAPYQPELFDEVARGFENEPERGKRCEKCFELRLKKSAQAAKELEIENLTTSIVISPHKDFRLISDIGKKISAEYNINYQEINFRKNDGVLKGNKIAKDLELYRQKYCGCKYSVR